MTIYNLMTMEGFITRGSGSSFSVEWIACWLSLLIVFYLGFVLRKQCSEGFLSGTNYNVIGAIALGLIADVLITTFTGSPGFAFLGGIAGVAAGGFGIGQIAPMDGGDSGGGDYE